jgi:hypothetical protein
MIIKARTYIENGFSKADADKLTPEISKALAETESNHEKILIDFEDVIYYTTLFFNQALTYLIGRLGKEKYLERISLLNLPESGQGTYEHALNYAIDYYAQDENARERQDKAINKIMDEL